MKTILHPASSRGHADHGWLKTWHSFSFASWYHPERMGFGQLRVLNDDLIEGGSGFGTHPHRDMEIVTLPLAGALEHKDSMGNRRVIRAGEIQAMSAGKGITHSEYNHHAEEVCELLQIWVVPREARLEPRYQEQHLDPAKLEGRLQQIVSPDPADDGVWIHQDAWFDLGHLRAGQELHHRPRLQDSAVYSFVIDGELEIGGHRLYRRDALGLHAARELSLKVHEDTRLLLIETPL